jgi:hypothetical protein
MQPTYYPINSTMGNLFKLAMYAMALVYLASCFTPLHIHFDSIRYYNLKDCMEHKCDPGSFAATDYLPYGYTTLLLIFSKLGILKSFSIILINCIYVFAGLYFIKKIFEQQVHTYLLIVVVLFNWVLIKFVTHPLSEMQYIFFSSASLYCFYLYRQKNSYFYLGLSFVLCILTIFTRTVGIALVPTLIFGVAWQHKEELKRIINKNKALLVIVAALCVALVFLARALKIVDYTNLLKGPLSQGVGHFLGTNLQNHFTELAEVFINLPSNKVMTYLPSSLGTIAFVALGVCCFAWFMYGTFSKRSNIPFFIRVYLLFYSFIILNWPYYDPRFWVPILPLIAAVILRTPFNSKPIIKAFGRLYLAVYLALGVFAALYSVYIGFDKERFSRNQAKGVYRNEYEVHFFRKPQSDTATHIDQNVLDILNKYD